MFLFVLGCKPEVEITTDTTDLRFEIRNESNVVVTTSVTVALYDNLAAYNTDVTNNNTANAYSTLTAPNDGNYFRFYDLSHLDNYWVRVVYNDGGGFTQSNVDGQYELINLLNKNALTTARISLAIDDVGHIAFWSRSSNSSNFDIEVFVQDQSQGMLNVSRSTAPSSSDQSSALMSQNLLPGVYEWYAKGQNGCVWQGQTTVVADDVTPILLEDCDHGSVTFWTQADLSSEGSIDIIIDLDNQIGTLSTALSGAPSGCFESGTVSASLPVGTHLYHGYSSSGTCLWTNSFTITSAGCTIIELSDCE